MTTEQLVADLARRVTPVRPLDAPIVRAMSWSALAVLSVAGGVLLFGARPDIATRVSQPGFAWTLVLGAALAAVASASALLLAVPGAERTPVLRVTATCLLAAWAFGLGWNLVRHGGSLVSDLHWPVCFVRAVAIGLVPSAALVAMVRVAAPLRGEWTGALAATAAMSAATIAVQIACPFDDPLHALVGHYAPVAVAAAAGCFAGRRLFSVTSWRPPA